MRRVSDSLLHSGVLNSRRSVDLLSQQTVRWTEIELESMGCWQSKRIMKLGEKEFVENSSKSFPSSDYSETDLNLHTNRLKSARVGRAFECQTETETLRKCKQLKAIIWFVSSSMKIGFDQNALSNHKQRNQTVEYWLNTAKLAANLVCCSAWIA